MVVILKTIKAIAIGTSNVSIIKEGEGVMGEGEGKGTGKGKGPQRNSSLRRRDRGEGTGARPKAWYLRLVDPTRNLLWQVTK